jgi:hypothetical protein
LSSLSKVSFKAFSFASFSVLIFSIFYDGIFNPPSQKNALEDELAKILFLCAWGKSKI